MNVATRLWEEGPQCTVHSAHGWRASIGGTPGGAYGFEALPESTSSHIGLACASRARGTGVPAVPSAVSTLTPVLCTVSHFFRQEQLHLCYDCRHLFITDFFLLSCLVQQLSLCFPLMIYNIGGQVWNQSLVSAGVFSILNCILSC